MVEDEEESSPRARGCARPRGASRFIGDAERRPERCELERAARKAGVLHPRIDPPDGRVVTGARDAVGAHLRVGLERGHREAASRELEGQVPGSGAEVDRARAAPQASGTERLGDRRGRVGRSMHVGVGERAVIPIEHVDRMNSTPRASHFAVPPAPPTPRKQGPESRDVPNSRGGIPTSSLEEILCPHPCASTSRSSRVSVAARLLQRLLLTTDPKGRLDSAWWCQGGRARRPTAG